MATITGDKSSRKSKKEKEDATFKGLGVVDVLCEACTKLKWTKPTKIQQEAIPVALSGRDIIGLAETGSGKTGAFALPILQSLLDSPQKLFALVLTPTRELAFQISEHFGILGESIGLKTAVIVGGVNRIMQAQELATRPHIIIATPGRLLDHLENTKGFNLKLLKYLVMDEADRILNMEFEMEVNKILKIIPAERRTFLFSATMTKKVGQLQRVALRDPVKVQVSSNYTTVEKLLQYYVFAPMMWKEAYLLYLLKKTCGYSTIVFCHGCATSQRLVKMLKCLGVAAAPLNGRMTQAKRLVYLDKFKTKSVPILVATDVASRGLDIPLVDFVINFEVPTYSKDYIHRVGRTARAGRFGNSITIVTQHDFTLYLRLEHLIGKKLPTYPVDEAQVKASVTAVDEALKQAKIEIKEADAKKKEKLQEKEEQGRTTASKRKMPMIKKKWKQKTRKQ